MPRFPAWPDVILIDGGQGQMSAVRAILDELGIDDDVTAIGVAKGVDRDAGRERFFMPGPRAVLAAGARSRALFRPAAARRGAPLRHRLAPRAPQEGDGQEPARRDRRHRARPQARAAACISAPPRRSAAPAIEDLMAVDGISEPMAKLVYNHFHES